MHLKFGLWNCSGQSNPFIMALRAHSCCHFVGSISVILLCLEEPVGSIIMTLKFYLFQNKSGWLIRDNKVGNTRKINRYFWVLVRALISDCMVGIYDFLVCHLIFGDYVEVAEVSSGRQTLMVTGELQDGKINCTWTLSVSTTEMFASIPSASLVPQWANVK